LQDRHSAVARQFNIVVSHLGVLSLKILSARIARGRGECNRED